MAHIMQCGVCLDSYDELYRRPKVLRCGHTFCLSCIKSFTQKKCPLDQKVITESAESLPDNYALNEGLSLSFRKMWCRDCSKVADKICMEEHSSLCDLRKARAHLYGGQLKLLEDAATATKLRLQKVEELSKIIIGEVARLREALKTEETAAANLKRAFDQPEAAVKAAFTASNTALMNNTSSRLRWQHLPNLLTSADPVSLAITVRQGKSSWEATLPVGASEATNAVSALECSLFPYGLYFRHTSLASIFTSHLSLDAKAESRCPDSTAIPKVGTSSWPQNQSGPSASTPSSTTSFPISKNPVDFGSPRLNFQYTSSVHGSGAKADSRPTKPNAKPESGAVPHPQQQSGRSDPTSSLAASLLTMGPSQASSVKPTFDQTSSLATSLLTMGPSQASSVKPTFDQTSSLAASSLTMSPSQASSIKPTFDQTSSLATSLLTVGPSQASSVKPTFDQTSSLAASLLTVGPSTASSVKPTFDPTSSLDVSSLILDTSQASSAKPTFAEFSFAPRKPQTQPTLGSATPEIQSAFGSSGPQPQTRLFESPKPGIHFSSESPASKPESQLTFIFGSHKAETQPKQDKLP